jgi:hypothetical protein
VVDVPVFEKAIVHMQNHALDGKNPFFSSLKAADDIFISRVGATWFPKANVPR